MKKTLLVSFAAASLLAVACGSSKAEEKKDAPATETPAATTDGAAPAATGDAAKAPEGSCGGEKKAGEGSCGGAPKN